MAITQDKAFFLFSSCKQPVTLTKYLIVIMEFEIGIAVTARGRPFGYIFT
jgi:hypothetical protein